MGQEDCKPQVSYVQVIYVLKRKKHSNFETCTTNRRGYEIINLDTLNDLLLRHPVCVAKIRNEKGRACMMHPSYSVALADIDL